MYETVHCFINPEPLNPESLNDYKCELKRYLLPEECPFLKQKKTIPSSAMRRDGNCKIPIDFKSIGVLLTPVFLLLRGFLKTVFAGYFEFGSAVITDNDLAFFHIGSQGKLSSTHRALCHNTPPEN